MNDECRTNVVTSLNRASQQNRYTLYALFLHRRIGRYRAYRRSNVEKINGGQCDLCLVSVDLPSASKTFLFQVSFPDIVIDDPR